MFTPSLAAREEVRGAPLLSYQEEQPVKVPSDGFPSITVSHTTADLERIENI